MGFRISTLQLYKHRILGSITLNFCNDDIAAEIDDIYSTVIIGANGIGKSHILNTIVEIFNYILALKGDIKYSSTPGYRFRIEYYIGDKQYVINSMADGFDVAGHGRRYVVKYYINNNQVTIHDCQLPEAIIASTMTVADKFTSVSNNIYQYKGIRNEKSPSTTGTKTLIRKTVSSILSCAMSKHGYKEELRGLLSKLGLQEKMIISYGMRHKEVFLRHDMSPQLLNDIFNNGKKYFPLRDTDIWGKTFFQKIKEQPAKIQVITDYLLKIERRRIKPTRYVAEYDVLNDNDIVFDAEAIELLTKLDILTFPTIKVYKDFENYNLMDSSSGETHLLCQFIGILSSIKNDSLIIIDEPENSSHPNWQINYIGWLKDIFQKYNSCHFIIATHSHFILTDLEERNSTIIALEETNGRLENIAENINTFCWSVDDILYRVFGVCNTRNHAFETDIMTLCKMMSEGSDDVGEIIRMTNKLSNFVLPKNDPLLEILNQARKYVEAR